MRSGTPDLSEGFFCVCVCVCVFLAEECWAVTSFLALKRENPRCTSAAELYLAWRAALSAVELKRNTSPPPSSPLPRLPLSAEEELCCGNNNGRPERSSPSGLSSFRESRVVRSVDVEVFRDELFSFLWPTISLWLYLNSSWHLNANMKSMWSTNSHQ